MTLRGIQRMANFKDFEIPAFAGMVANMGVVALGSYRIHRFGNFVAEQVMSGAC